MDVLTVKRLIDTKIQPRLSVLVERMQYVSAVKQEHQELSLILQNETSAGQGATTLIDVGSGFQVQAEPLNADTIYINIGLGFHVEYNRADAISYISEKVEALST